MRGRWLAVLGVMGVSACSGVSIVGDVDGEVPDLRQTFYAAVELPSEYEDALFDGEDMLQVQVWSGVVGCEELVAHAEDVKDLAEDVDWDDADEVEAFEDDLGDLWGEFFPDDAWSMLLVFLVPEDDEIDEDVDPQDFGTSQDVYYSGSLSFREDGGEDPERWVFVDGELTIQRADKGAAVTVEGDIELAELAEVEENPDDPDVAGELQIQLSASLCEDYEDVVQDAVDLGFGG